MEKSHSELIFSYRFIKERNKILLFLFPESSGIKYIYNVFEPKGAF